MTGGFTSEALALAARRKGRADKGPSSTWGRRPGQRSSCEAFSVAWGNLEHTLSLNEALGVTGPRFFLLAGSEVWVELARALEVCLEGCHWYWQLMRLQEVARIP